MTQFWRQIGLSYVKYLNLNSMMARRCLKEPLKTKALERDGVHFSIAEWKNGKATKPVSQKIQDMENVVNA